MAVVLIACGIASCSRHVERRLTGRATPTAFLVCAAGTTAAPDVERVGKYLGKTLRSGDSRLKIPFRGLRSPSEFTFAEASRDTVRVDLTTNPPADFRKAARLVISLERCTPAQIEARNWVIWRYSDGKPAEPLQTEIDVRDREARTWIDSNSYYVMAD